MADNGDDEDDGDGENDEDEHVVNDGCECVNLPWIDGIKKSCLMGLP